MHITIKNLDQINKEINEKIKEYNYKNYLPKVIAVSKTFNHDHIMPLVENGHLHFGENKVQEAIEKWSSIKEKNNKVKLHMIGKLQTNKVKQALKIFDYIHSVDSIKLAQKIHDEQLKSNKEVSIFLQVNIGKEHQKSGVDEAELKNLIDFCSDKKLKLIGLMCLPPFDQDSNIFFTKLYNLNMKYKFTEISMGMSHDYIHALKHKSTFLRIGSKIFGKRS